MSWVANQKDRDRRNRLKLRAELIAQGLNEQLIEKIIEQQRHEDLVARHGLEGAREVAYIEAHRRGLDDTGFQPSTGDPLLRGPARVGGITARVVRRRDTITQRQYNNLAEKAQTDTPFPPAGSVS